MSIPVPEDEGGFFTQNRGQWAEDIRFVGTASFGRIAILKDGWLLDLPSVDGGEMIRYELQGASANPQGSDPTGHMTNYLIGNTTSGWVTDVPSYRFVTYDDAWNGIDIRFTNRGGCFKFDIISHPGSDLSEIVIGLKGHRSLEVTGNVLHINSKNMEILESMPQIYYDNDPGRSILSSYRILSGDHFTYEVPGRDPERTLVIDPLIYSTFIGSASSESGKGIGIDSKGCAYITGMTQSTSFPSTNGSYDCTHNGGRDVFISKFDSTGSNLVYSTFIGGTNSSMIEEGLDLCVDGFGNVTVLADTGCKDFPTTIGAFDATYNGNFDSVVFRLNSTGSGLIFSTFIGGSGMDSGDSLVIDEKGCSYIVGDTFSSDMPSTSGAYDSSASGSVDIFVAKLSKDGSGMHFLTYLGQDAYASGIDYDSTGVYVAASTWTSAYPTTNGAYDRTANGGNDIVVTKLNANGTSLLFSTYIGGNTHDYATSIKVDADGATCVSGMSWSNNFPTTSGAYDTTSNNIHSNGIVFKLNATGASLKFSTYLGGSGTLGEVLREIVIDRGGNVYVCGDTDSLNYPTTSRAYDTTHSGSGSDCVLSILNNAGSILAYSTFLGGTNSDFCYGVELDKKGNIYLTGQTDSSDFPANTGSYDTSQNGLSDAFVFKLNVSIKLPPSPPRNVTGWMGRGFVTLSWEGPEFDGGSKILNYTIFRGAPGEALVRIGSSGPSDRTFNDSAVDIGKPYCYSLSCNNSAGPSLQSPKVLIRDIHAPIIVSVTGDESAVTGSSFNVTARVYDDIVLSCVDCIYWYGNGEMTITEMVSLGGDDWHAEFVVEDTVEDLHIRIQARDASKNEAVPRTLNLTISGSILPYIFEDRSDPCATTGDLFNIRTRAIDNFGIREVHAEIEMSGMNKKNVSLNEGQNGLWTGSTEVPSDYEDSLIYSFSAVDINGNWNRTPLIEVDVLDNDAPIFRSDTTSESCTAGFDLDIITSYHDNIVVESVNLNYTFDGVLYFIRMMQPQGGSYWREKISVLNDARWIEYYTYASDRAGNIATSEIRKISVMDKDLPEIVSDMSPGFATCGSDYGFQLSVRDNTGIRDVWIEYWFTDASHEHVGCDDTKDCYAATISIPIDSCDPLSYFVHASDSHGNLNVSDLRTIPVLDRTPPVIEDLPNIECAVGQVVELCIDPVDNIGVKSVVWDNPHVSIIGNSFKWTAKESGTFSFNISVTDVNNNSAYSEFDILVLESPIDSDGDGIGDAAEIGNGLDPFDMTDASLDKDSDGLTNLDEFQRGTDISNDDTDEDGMTDGWEVRYGLDPLTYSAENDTDGDGVTDRNEYLRSTDPTVKDSEKESDDPISFSIIIVILLSIAALLVAGSAIVLLIRSRKSIPRIQPVNLGSTLPSSVTEPPDPSRDLGSTLPTPSVQDSPGQFEDWMDSALTEYEVMTSADQKIEVSDDPVLSAEACENPHDRSPIKDVDI